MGNRSSAAQAIDNPPRVPPEAVAEIDQVRPAPTPEVPVAAAEPAILDDGLMWALLDSIREAEIAWTPPRIDILESDLAGLCTALHSNILVVSGSAVAAHDELEQLRLAERARVLEKENAADVALLAIDVRYAALRDAIIRAEASKVAAIETELVAADSALERFHGVVIDEKQRDLIAAQFGSPPLVPAEPADLFLVHSSSPSPSEQSEPTGSHFAVGGAGTVRALCAPRAVDASQLTVRAVPTAVRLGRPFQFDVVIDGEGMDAEGEEEATATLRAMAATLAKRLRVDAALLPLGASTSYDTSTPATAAGSALGDGPAPNSAARVQPVPLEASCVVNAKGDGVRVTLILPPSLPASGISLGAHGSSTGPCAPSSSMWALRVVHIRLGPAPLTDLGHLSVAYLVHGHSCASGYDGATPASAASALASAAAAASPRSSLAPAAALPVDCSSAGTDADVVLPAPLLSVWHCRALLAGRSRASVGGDDSDGEVGGFGDHDGDVLRSQWVPLAAALGAAQAPVLGSTACAACGVETQVVLRRRREELRCITEADTTDLPPGLQVGFESVRTDA
jgi:hypothetical protein